MPLLWVIQHFEWVVRGYDNSIKNSIMRKENSSACLSLVCADVWEKRLCLNYSVIMP